MDNNENFIQDMANKAISSGANVTIVQNIRHERMTPINPIEGMIEANMMRQLIGIMGSGHDPIEIENFQGKILIADSEELRNVTEKYDYNELRIQNIEKTEELVLPVITLNRSTDWKQIVYTECNLNSEDIVLIKLRYGEGKIQYTLVFPSEEIFKKFSNEYDIMVDVASNIGLCTNESLFYIIEPVYSEVDAIAFDTTEPVPEIGYYYSIYKNKPERCIINSIDFWQNYAGYLIN